MVKSRTRKRINLLRCKILGRRRNTLLALIGKNKQKRLLKENDEPFVARRRADSERVRTQRRTEDSCSLLLSSFPIPFACPWQNFAFRPHNTTAAAAADGEQKGGASKQDSWSAERTQKCDECTTISERETCFRGHLECSPSFLSTNSKKSSICRDDVFMHIEYWLSVSFNRFLSKLSSPPKLF